MNDYYVGCTVRIGNAECVVDYMGNLGVYLKWPDGGNNYFAFATLERMGAEVVKPQRVWQDGNTIAWKDSSGMWQGLRTRIKGSWFSNGARSIMTDAVATERIEQDGWKFVTITEVDDE